MDGVPPIFLASATGLISGLALSIPVGPINLTILNDGARLGFKWAAMIGFGATVMEVIYCFIAFTGFASFFSGPWIKLGMEIVSFVFLMFLGIKFLLAKSLRTAVPMAAMSERIEHRLEEKLHPHSAFMIGLVRVMGNVGVLIFWIVLAASFIRRELVTPDWPGKLACVAGVGVGTGSWFMGLSWAASKGRGKFSEQTMLRMERFSGVILVVLALVHGGMMMWRLSRQGI